MSCGEARRLSPAGLSTHRLLWRNGAGLLSFSLALARKPKGDRPWYFFGVLLDCIGQRFIVAWIRGTPLGMEISPSMQLIGRRRYALCAVAVALSGSPLTDRHVAAQIATPVAIIEEADSNAPVAMFDYLKVGDQISLSSTSRIVIGYLSSCRIETISGGDVTIGELSSTVRGGRMTVDQVACDAGEIELTTEAAAASGVTVYRVGEEDVVLYSATPAFVANDRTETGTIEIRRLDRSEETKRVPLRNGHADLAQQGIAINPGGRYLAQLGDRRLTFRIVVYGRPGGPLLGRLVRF